MMGWAVSDLLGITGAGYWVFEKLKISRGF